ncbi:hypothetical protein RclHR1_17890004 [Rhizophagus clarus]|uniref:Crinkler effector protein N-terminal domain-containing protein n=1 Tax=Rhizophagus clarus TaxID=94130 RepID=A0A2Z6QKW1_9GLOM|nr:hypothetical protein RclHR1_17890004 [Rhizophagus clarus]
MENSFNCLFLEDYSVIPIPIYKDKDNEKFVILLDQKIYVNKFTVALLNEYICKKKQVDNSKLWKVDVKKKEIKDKNVTTEEDIVQKLYGKEMEPEELFEGYFKDENFIVSNIHIIAIFSTTACPSQQGVLQVPLKSVEDILKSVLEDFTSRTSETHTSRSDTYISQFDCYDMPLKDRDLSKIAAIIKRNVINNLRVDSSRSNAKTDFNILVRGEAPGIGKTRLGNELFHNIETNGESLFENITGFKRFEYIYLDFGNSIKLDERDYSLDNDKIICLRILYKYFIMRKYNLSFEVFRDRVLPHIKILNIPAVFASIRKNLLLKDAERLFIFLHIDEFQLIFKWDEGRDDKLFKYIINNFAPEYMHGNSSHFTFVQEFFSGTAREAAVREKEASKLTLESIKCPTLSMKSMIQIVDFYAEKYGAEKINGEYMWKLCSKFLHIIQDTGGLPRALQYMLALCFEELNTEGEFFRKISEQDFGNISRLTANKLQSLYGIYNTIRASNKIAWELLYHCVMEKLVAPGDCLDPNNKTDTIENLETETHIILR